MATNVGGRVYGIRGWSGWSHQKRAAKIRDLAEAYGRDPRMRWFVVHHVLKPAGVVDFRDYPRTAQALLSWVQPGGPGGLYYTNESDEQLQSPWWTLKVKTGDCDDYAILLGAMAHSVRLPWRIVLAGQSRKGVERWNEEFRPNGKPYQPRIPGNGWSPSHIYVDLGWPPFTEGKKDPLGRPLTTWVAAEPTMRLPLGLDPVRRMQQRAALAKLTGQAQQAMLPELAGMGPWFGGTPPAVDTRPFHQRVLERLDPAIFVANVVLAGTSALLIRWLLRKIDRR